MELLMVILLFAVCAAICLQMFAYASLTAKNAENLSYGAMMADSCGACYQATHGDLQQMASLLAGSVQEERVVVCYDADWNTVTQDGCYQLTCTPDGNTATIAVVEGEDLIYTLHVQVTGGGDYE